MFFKRLELYGFKSFAHKTVIDFFPGATVIVGPNGCGKSNVMDSIRWVLGEQRARAMRGQRMGEVIFNGSASVKAMNVSRVTVVLDNENRVLDMDADELQIGRQLLRTGESEYTINRIPCRMRSIQELLMDTGAGVNAYSILEQGRVDQIVTAKPEERRIIFEEAAGISRYKQRKVEALRKLERTESDLARLADIIREVKGQSLSLKRQANRALRFRALDAELTQLEMALISLTYAAESQRRDAERSRLEKEQAVLDDLVARMETAEGELEQQRVRTETLEEEVRDLQTRLNHERESIAKYERAIALFGERRGAYERQSRQLVEEAQAAAAQAEKIDAQSVEVRTARDHTETEARRLEALRDEKLEAQRSIRREQEQRRADLRERQKELEQLRERQRRRENEARLSQSRCEAIESQTAKAREQLATHSAQRADLERRLEEKTADIQRLEALVAERRAQLEHEIRVNTEGEETLRRLLTELESTIQVHSESNSRLTALRELEKRFEGYSGGVRETMNAAGEGRLQGLQGVLARLIRARGEYDTAIEIALASNIESIVTASARDAERAIDYLREAERGRALFLPLDSLHSPTGERTEWLEAIVRRAGVIDIASRLVECDAALRPAVEAVLGSTIIVEDLDVALGLQREGHCERYVTLNGEVISPEGVIAGGALQQSRLLGREREIDELSERVAELKAREDALREAVFARRESLRAGGETLNQLREETHRADVDLARARNDRDQTARAIGDIARRIEEHNSSICELETELAKTRGHIEGLSAEARQIGEQADAAARAIDERLAAVENLDKALADASEALNQAGIELTSARERHAALRDRAAALQAEGDRARRAAEQKTAQIATLTEQIAAAEREQQEAIAELTALRARHETTEKQAAERSEEREQHLKVIEEARRSLQTLMRDRNEAQNRVHEADLRLQQANLRIEQLNEQAREKFRKTCYEVVEDVAALRQKIAQREADAQAASTQPAIPAVPSVSGVPSAALAPIDGEDGEPEPQATEEELLFDLPEDPDVLRGRIRPIREQIARLGPINTVAIEEYDELRKRYVFLQAQEKDMTEARESLIKTIKTIDKTSRDLFQESFDIINKHFQDMFRRLFNGGKAMLKLDETADDILDAGVEIIAQPPGKQISSLSMMSGGEKALTAIAVLFAIFQHRPSPFCVLDEIDAPLDDANCQRLVNMLREFSKTVQFIIITHNKITMQLADTIYGVTMDEPGVSRILSIPRHLLKDAEDVRRHAKAQAAGGNEQ